MSLSMRPLWDHQVQAVRKAETCKDMFLAMEMGTGKSRTTIEILRRRYAQKGKLLKTLIICPVIVCDNWKREWAMYSKVNPNDVIVLTTAGKRRVQDFLRAVGDDLSHPKIVITNYQGMLMKDLYDLLRRWQPDVLVCDESHKLKNHQSKTFKLISAMSAEVRQKFLLTGTPILNTPMDIWAQYKVLDDGETFGKNFFSFRAAYFRDENAGWSTKENHFPKWTPNPETMERIKLQLQHKMIRVTKEECMSLPPLVRQEIPVTLGAEQARMYSEMKKEFLAFLKDAETKHPMTVTAQLAITKALRLQQIVSGYAATEQDGAKWLKDNPRIDVLEELLETITPGNKVIVWSVFKENYKMIADLCTRMGLEYSEIHGDISNAKRIDEMDRFRTDPKCRVMIANQSAGGSGINLVEASYAIYYSKGFSLEHDLQSEARNHRGGSEMHTKVTRIDLVATSTIDELINEALSKKQNIANLILTWKERM